MPVSDRSLYIFYSIYSQTAKRVVVLSSMAIPHDDLQYYNHKRQLTTKNESVAEKYSYMLEVKFEKKINSYRRNS